MRRVEKPWGHEIIWAETSRYVGKILFIKAGHKLSRQFHNVKDETIMVESGEMDFEIGAPPNVEVRRLRVREPFHVTPGTVHRMVAVTDCEIFEVSTTELDDVVRLEDSYGREGTSKA
jgi:quercetin dioxygenase-like cupin family protein